MRIQRVLLITLASQNYVANNVNSGVGYISEALENSGVEYDIIDMLTGKTYDDLKKKINKYSPGLLAFNMFTPMYLRNYELLKQIKKDFPAIPIMCGGPHISTVKDHALKDCKAIDYGVLNEGEEIISEFISGVEEENINGLIRRVNDQIILNPTRLPILNLDNISFPKYRKVNLKQYVMHSIPLVTSRGCPYSCIFCTVKSTMGQKIRFRSPENVVNEIEYWFNKGINDFTIDDDNFTFDEKRVFDICDEIEKRKIKKVEFRLHNGVRPDRTSLELLKRLKSVGFNFVKISVEGGNDKVLRSLKKATSIARIEQCIKESIEAGIEVQLNFVVGSPGETWSDLVDSINIAEKYRVWRVNFLNLIPFPGTELFEWVEKNNYFIENPTEYLNKQLDFSKPVFVTPTLSKEDREHIIVIQNKLNKKLIYNVAKMKLERFGYAGKIVAFVFATKICQNIYLQNSIARKIMDKIRRLISEKIN